MATFLFWNMGKKALEEPLFRLVKRHSVDVLILAECGLSSGAILEILNREQSSYHFPSTPLPDRGKLRIFTRFSGDLLKHEDNHSKFRWTIRQFLPIGSDGVLIVAVHLYSKMNYNSDSQKSDCRDLAEHIRRVEDQVGHQRMLVIGDFNMNPFEAGMYGLKYLNAEATRTKASARIRNIDGTNYPFFYNPMWNFFGDHTRGPAGTYHYKSSEPVRMAWNILDQVLLRPTLLPFFDINELEILSDDGENSFLTSQSGIPGANNGSDHLPIVFRLNL